MGDWTRVRITGTCAQGEVDALNAALHFDPRTLEGFHCLCCGGICGLPRYWGSPKIDAVGNLGERGYSHQDVADQLELLAKVAPSLTVFVDLGDHNESEVCVATIILREGKATIGPPLTREIPPLSEAQMKTNMAAYMSPHR